MHDYDGNRKYLNQSDRAAFLLTIEADADLSERTFCQTLFYTGCRVSEALELTIERVDLGERTVMFRTLKQRDKLRFRSVPVPEHLIADLAKLIKGKLPGERLWSFSRTTAWRVIKRRMIEAKISGIKACPKGLRHGFAVAALSEKIPITTVKKWLGHTRLETTEIYLDVVGTEERELASRLWSRPEGGTQSLEIFTDNVLQFIRNELARMSARSDALSVKQYRSDSVSSVRWFFHDSSQKL